MAQRGQGPPTQGSASVLPGSQGQGSSLAETSNEVCNEACTSDISESSPTHFGGQLPVHSDGILRQQEALQSAFMSNSQHVTGSTSGGAFLRTEGPSTGVMSICGLRPEMEDSVTVAHRLLLYPCKKSGGCSRACLSSSNEGDVDLPWHFFAVYDGHGGSQVSFFCKEKLHLALAKEMECYVGAEKMGSTSAQLSWERRWEKAMRSTFCKIDAEIEGYAWKTSELDETRSVRERISEPLTSETVGSTAIVAVIGSCHIVVANCGDSRAVLSRGGQAIAMSSDHKPNREDELERIEAAGGRVIFWNGYRVFGVLAMSRAIGDRYLKPYVIAEPEVTCLSRVDEDECLILASDGLWDVLTNEEVCEVARKFLRRQMDVSSGSRSPGYTIGSNDKRAEAAAALLTKMALARGSQDNISVIVVDLKDRTRSHVVNIFASLVSSFLAGLHKNTAGTTNGNSLG